ncbi:hypothetical protein [Bergeyella zoohelcum]|uniref:hypothetical protein n=1 Tax=Bergeyella zoohelcum TaxID=1015 RepID=UPI002A91BE93|nr:hypothetical protein [Bergeyella zoohelcum]MDY6025310.1 hypothetical protein [Bergeyella zoohelcum]
MNKTTVKISVLAFLGFMTYGYAQQHQQDPYKGKVGINTIEPSATMDIRPSTANAQKEATTNEGIIAPKLSKTRIANIETPIEGTLVYATDETASPISAYTGGDMKVAKITEKGYYFYNGTEWVKAGSDANDQLWAQRDNGGVTETYLKPADANSDFVGYRSDRKFRFNLGNLQENDFNYQSTDPNTSKGLAMLEVPFLTAISSDVLPEESTVGKKNKFFFSSNNALLKEKHVSKNPIGRYYGREDRIVIKDVDSKADTVYGTSGVVDLHSNNQLVGMIGVQGLSIAGTENGAYSNAMVKTIKGGAFKTSNFVNTERMEGISVAVRNYKKADNLNRRILLYHFSIYS